jgi:hypothetical protein
MSEDERERQARAQESLSYPPYPVNGWPCTESLREAQARSQEADRIGPDQERADNDERNDA